MLARSCEEVIFRDVLLRLAPCDGGAAAGPCETSGYPQVEFWKDVNYGSGDPVDARVRARLLLSAEDCEGVELAISPELFDPLILPVRASEVETELFVVYGGMGLGMPGGLLNQGLAALFPRQFESIQQQMHQYNEAQGGDLMPSDFTGHVYLSFPQSAAPRRFSPLQYFSSAAASESPREARLISCIAFPRAVDEERNTQKMFTTALELAVREGTKSSRRTSRAKIRVLTHSLGAFHGHNEPAKFAHAMANGLRDFLSGRKS